MKEIMGGMNAWFCGDGMRVLIRSFFLHGILLPTQVPTSETPTAIASRAPPLSRKREKSPLPYVSFNAYDFRVLFPPILPLF